MSSQPSSQDSNPDSDEEIWSSVEELPSDFSSTPSLSFSSSPGLSQEEFSRPRLCQPYTSATSRPLKRKRDDSPGVLAKKLKHVAAGTVHLSKTTSSAVDTGPVLIASLDGQADQSSIAAFNGLSTGVLWEIARLASLERLTNVSVEDIKSLRGTNSDAAPKTVEILLKEKTRDLDTDRAFSAERKSQCPWQELDAEEAALLNNPNSALGNFPESPKGFYGGKVGFIGNIDEVAGRYNVTLDRCTLTTSCRLCRQFGSSSILRLKVPLKILHHNQNLRTFVRRPFVILGNVFRAFYAKETTVFLFRTRENYSNGQIYDPPSGGLSLFDFLDQFNPLQLNTDQALCKWASRFALGLSNSVPGPVLPPARVDEINDILSFTKSNMTDGCGISNVAFNLKLKFDFQLETIPCAVQVRHGGKKGILLMCPDSTQDATPQLAFRNPSQVKIRYSEASKADPANATVDILRFSRTKCPTRISAEVIINLEHNGVPADVFVRMQEAYIAKGVEELLLWAQEPGSETTEVMMQLWTAVEKSEDVYSARRVREAVGEARFRGFRERYNDATPDEEDDSELFDGAVHERSIAWWPDYISGSPSSLAETCMVLLDSGFTPQSLPVLRDKLKQIVRTKIKHRANRFIYEVAQSASAFVVPDHWGVLEENEIHFKSSRRQFPTDDGLQSDIILGDVLMTRNPCKLPTDVRKLRAVKHSQLHDLVDVIVCSVKGQRRLLDYLAGGDYDGDTAIVIWDKEIVDAFTNADEKYSIEPKGVNQCFEQTAKTVGEFIRENGGKSPAVKASMLQEYLLGSLRDPSAVGQYSGMHDNSVVKQGYSHPNSIRLAYLFCKILDSPKTGHQLKQKTWDADKSKHGHVHGPAWKNGKKDKKEVTGSALNTPYLQRNVDPTNPLLARPFIMDVLNQTALLQRDQWLKDAEDIFAEFEQREVVLDPDLAKPWNDFSDFVARQVRVDKKPKEDLEKIGKHVEAMYARHTKEIKGYSSSSASFFTDAGIKERQDKLRALSYDFAARPKPGEELKTLFDEAQIARLRASYAYIYDHENNGSKGWSRFPWNVALGELCKIKASALGPQKSVVMQFYERFRLGGNRR
ncbi:dimethylaniline monooxygenase [Favolaschia claudopus]|uniref:RNA-dependent RNA polymerase n=1 Tax=Favolaschia claudopus TaxID=2862362 RepID=A0AAW0B1C0_9AGAR